MARDSQEKKTGSAAWFSFSRHDGKASPGSSREKLLGIHGKEPARTYWVLPPVVP